MTHPTTHPTVVLAVFTRTSGLRAWTLITQPGWNPTVTDTLDADLRTHQFTDPDFDITATIMIFRADRTGRIHQGYLIPTVGRCPLCDDRRSITVRHDPYPGDTSATGDLIMHTLIHWGEDAAAAVIDRATPCPACRLVDYLLTLDASVPGVDPQ